MTTEELKILYNEDLLERKSCILTLTDYIKNLDFKVFSIHSPWGTGKTTFVNFWKYYLEKDLSNEFYCIYFNAWENDDSNNPLLSIILELKNKEFYNNSSELNSLISAASVLTEKAPKVILKGFLGLTNLNENTKKKIDKTFSSLIDDGLTFDTLKKVFEDKDKLDKKLSECGEYQVEILKRELKSVLKEALIEFQKKQNKKIIFFVDELDRCKPTYAVKTLEIIKHFFSLDNYYFILSWDLEQLSYSISTLYGSNMDSGGYLRRFIDFEYTLPHTNLEKYIDKKFGNKSLLLKYFIKAFDFSLRDINKISDLFKISKSIKNFYKIISIKNSSYDKQAIYFRYIGEIFLLLKYKYPVLYIKLKNKTINSFERESLKNIIKTKTDAAIIKTNASYFKISNFSNDTIELLLKNFLEVDNENIISEIKIDNETTINFTEFIDKGVNKLIDISVYFENDSDIFF